ncbi:MAG: MgtC/SapB family protein [Cyanobacteria bacterium RM1_2_2]|nr:MgtC/SapB family protein [Cyanobacteria bacterium RM1_2_2]
MLNTGLELVEPTDWVGVVVRLGLAVLMGGVVGFEREVERKPAGFRTHMLVSLGAALFVLIGIQTGVVQAEPNTISRIIQGLIAGIGFVGAGEIFSTARSKSGSSPTSERVEIQGLTSAAAIWVSAALGTAAGCGLWFMSLVGAVATVLILWAAKKLEARI